MNALVSLGFMNHEFQGRVASWIQSGNSLQPASCSITELGFLRVLGRTPSYGFTVAQARTLLLRLKQGHLTFIPDGHDVSHLPAWVKAPKQITDGHLSKLAASNGAVPATLDERIPGSYLIPK